MGMIFLSGVMTIILSHIIELESVDEDDASHEHEDPVFDVDQ